MNRLHNIADDTHEMSTLISSEKIIQNYSKVSSAEIVISAFWAKVFNSHSKKRASMQYSNGESLE